MSYPRLNLMRSSPAVAAVSVATEPYLEQAHFLLSRTFGASCRDHFGLSAVIMTLLSIAAASAVRHFDIRTNRRRFDKSDAQAFKEAVVAYFPWEDVSVEFDIDEPSDWKVAAAEQLYQSARNPLVHIGGIAAKGFRLLRVVHSFPGGSDQDNDFRMAHLCAARTLDRQCFLRVRPHTVELFTRELYWCARRMIETLASDADALADIERHLSAQQPRNT
jgi:hypothetical protein